MHRVSTARWRWWAAMCLAVSAVVSHGHALGQAAPAASTPGSRDTVRACTAGLRHTVGLLDVKPPAASMAATCACALTRMEADASLRPRAAALMGPGDSGIDGAAAQLKTLGIVLGCLGAELERRSADQPGAALGSDTTLLLPGTPWPASHVPPRRNQRAPPKARFDKRCQPEYPPHAARTEATGITKLALLIDKSGRATKVRIDRSSGDTFAHKLLDFQAAAALSTCPFDPAQSDDGPMESWTKIDYVWRLQ